MWPRTIGGLCCLAVFLCCHRTSSAEATSVTSLSDFYQASTPIDAPDGSAAARISPPEPASRSAFDIAALEQRSNDGPAKLASDESELADRDGCGYGANGCGESILCCPCNMCPCTYAWAEGLMLWRDNDAMGRAVVLDLNTGDALISADDPDFDMGGGVRAGFSIRRCSNWGWEFQYFGVFGQDDSEFVALADGLAIPGDLGLSTNNFFFADEVSVDYESDLHNAEVNRVCCCSDGCRTVEFLYGFRYLNLNEEFTLVATDFQEGTSTYNVETENNLFGAQFGSRVRRFQGRWHLEGTGKAGIFGNAAELDSDPIVDFPAFVVRPGRSASEGDVAFVGDLNLTAIYRLNNVWGLRLGYNLIWIEGVALAPDQLDFTNTTDSGKDVSADGGVFLHGVNAGAEARW
jgi:hypothetical protein